MLGLPPTAKTMGTGMDCLIGMSPSLRGCIASIWLFDVHFLASKVRWVYMGLGK